MPTIKPIDEDIILTAARECRRIITVEEHSIIGGGRGCLLCRGEKLPVPVRRIGVMDQFGHSGPAARSPGVDYGLTAENIVSAVREMVRPDQPPLNKPLLMLARPLLRAFSFSAY